MKNFLYTGLMVFGLHQLTAQTSIQTKASTTENQKSTTMYPKIQEFQGSLHREIAAISDERRAVLMELSTYIQEKLDAKETLELVFICTHNSRRSHFGQIWAMAAAHSVGLGQFVRTYSGGTEVTAFNERAVAALQRAGFVISKSGEDNPDYTVTMGENLEPIHGFSKTYEHASIPKKGFAAVMTCSEADRNCPFVPGAEYRLSLPYTDPKVSDGTPEETAVYDLRSRQIAAEMLYVFQMLKP